MNAQALLNVVRIAIAVIILVSAIGYHAIPSVVGATDSDSAVDAGRGDQGNKEVYQINVEAPPTLETQNYTIFVIFRFGAMWAIAKNGSRVMPPIYVYVYSTDPSKVVEVVTSYGEAGAGSYGLVLNVTKYEYYKDLMLTVDNNYTLMFRIVPTAEEVKEEKPPAMITLEQLKQWLDREAQAAAVIACVAIVLAFGIKRKTLLIRLFNGLNIVIIVVSSIVIYYIARTSGHSEWLVAVFIPSYLISYAVIRAGRKVYLIKIIPSLRKILWETAVLYRTAEGWLAYAKQTVGEAFKRMLGKHIVLKDAEINKAGEVPEDKFWSVEDVEVYSRYDGLLVVDAQLTKERVALVREEEKLYRGEEE